jgi:malate synthase
VVDEQNASDPNYQPMVIDIEPRGHAFDAALQLVTRGCTEPGGYTEPRLHQSRRQKMHVEEIFMTK